MRLAVLSAVFISTVLSAGARVLQAQVFPAFANPGTVSWSVPPLTGVSLVSFHSDVYPNLLLAFYTDGPTGVLAYASQTDASSSTFLGSSLANTGSSPETYFVVDQNAVTGQSTSGISTMVFNNNLYVAYVEANSHQFVVLKASIIPGQASAYFFNEVYRDTTPGFVNTAAGTAVLGTNLVFVYGTARNPSIKNEAWTTWLDANGAWHSEDSGLNSPTQPGIAAFQGTNYLIQKQNNSNNGLFLNWVDDTGHYIANSDRQISGGNVYWRTPFGFSMLVWNNELIFAADGQGGGSPLCIYATYDGVNWVGRSYPGLYIGNAPSIALFNGEITAAGQVNGSQWTMLATHD